MNTLKLTVALIIALLIGFMAAQANAQTVDDVNNQRLNKVLDALDKAEALIDAQKQVISAKDAVIVAKEGQITANLALIESLKGENTRLRAVTCTKSSFLIFIYRTKKCF